MSLKKLVLAACALGMASSANANTIYDFSLDNLNSVNTSGVINSLGGWYSDDQNFSFEANLSRNNYTGLLANAGWLIVSPGEQPRNNVSEQAILYFNFDTGNVYAYSYDGTLGGNTFQNQDNFITSFENGITVDSNGTDLTARIDIDATAIQNFSDAAGWTGVSFGEQVGIWSHFFVLDSFASENGLITDLDPGSQSFFDTIDPETTQIPEPAGLALFGLATLGGLVVARRRKEKAAE